MQNKIISTLAKYPDKNLFQVSKILGITSMQVSEAQHEHLKVKMAKYRCSPMWDKKAYNKQKL